MDEPTGQTGRPTRREYLTYGGVGGALLAIQEGRFYPGGNPVQGPLANRFQLEMTAKQLYPEQFGAWLDYEQGDPYPAFDADERLFDRDRVADIVVGGE
jgi:hypothetical protein